MDNPTYILCNTKNLLEFIDFFKSLFLLKRLQWKDILRKLLIIEILSKYPKKIFSNQQNLDRFSYNGFKFAKSNCVNPMLFNGGFKIYLPDHPEPQ